MKIVQPSYRIFLLIIALLSCGGVASCSKNSTEEAPTAATTDETVSGDPDAKLAEAQLAIEKEQYDAAVQAIIQAQVAATAEQAAAMEQQRLDTMLKLQQAAQRDPKAKEAYDGLGRMMTGR